MIRRPPRATRTDTLFPYTTLFRSIVVQVPGLQDPAALKALLGKTARLDFKMVDVRATPEDMAEGRAPIGSEVLPYPDDPRGLGMIAVERRPVVTGDQLIDASIGQDQYEIGRAHV